jgi:hypothetical protein
MGGAQSVAYRIVEESRSATFTFHYYKDLPELGVKMDCRLKKTESCPIFSLSYSIYLKAMTVACLNEERSPARKEAHSKVYLHHRVYLACWVFARWLRRSGQYWQLIRSLTGLQHNQRFDAADGFSVKWKHQLNERLDECGPCGCIRAADDLDYEPPERNGRVSLLSDPCGHWRQHAIHVVSKRPAHRAFD